jgi:hypothetical protein
MVYGLYFVQYNPFFLCKKGEIVKVYNKSSFLVLVTIFFSIHTSQRQDSVAISTIPQAIVALRNIIFNAPADNIALQSYEKEQSGTIVDCAKVLYDTAYAQILATLQEINIRLAYWREQKNRPWKYFLEKSPIKWFTGVPQQEEIQNNIEQLQSHQGELYVMLGQLAEYGNEYEHTYKTIFRDNVTQAYAWVDGLLDVLARIKVAIKDLDTMPPFIARVMVLKAKLEKVRSFKNQIVSEMKEAQIPAHLVRHWLKYAFSLLFLGQIYKYSSEIGDLAMASFDWTKNYMMESSKTVKEMFFPGRIQYSSADVAQSAMVNFLDRMEKAHIINDAEKMKIIEDVAKGSNDEFRKFLNEKIMKYTTRTAWYAPEGWSIFLQLFGENAGKEISSVRNITLLAPATFVGLVGYYGLRNIYQKTTAKNYTAIRRALIDINSLFVDASRPLDDEQYGKMLYLIYDLKKRVMQDIPFNDCADFINDLERVESKEFNVAAKRAIVDDMFRKYSFLKLT